MLTVYSHICKTLSCHVPSPASLQTDRLSNTATYGWAGMSASIMPGSACVAVLLILDADAMRTTKTKKRPNPSTYMRLCCWHAQEPHDTDGSKQQHQVSVRICDSLRDRELHKRHPGLCRVLLSRVVKLFFSLSLGLLPCLALRLSFVPFPPFPSSAASPA